MQPPRQTGRPGARRWSRSAACLPFRRHWGILNGALLELVRMLLQVDPRSGLADHVADLLRSKPEKLVDIPEMDEPLEWRGLSGMASGMPRRVCNDRSDYFLGGDLPRCLGERSRGCSIS